MTDILNLLKTSSAYGIVAGDKENGRVSHAYLLITPDKKFIGEYLKAFAKTLLGAEEGSRMANLIDGNIHPDVLYYPKDSDAVVKDDVIDIIEQSYVKPIETEKKIFIIANAETMNDAAQNKLLKTLEEPPENVCILIGATGEYSLLPTIKSRTKKLEIAAFSNEKIAEALKSECPDKEKLSLAVSCGDGTLGRALALYNDQSLTEITDLAAEILTDMKSSKEVLYYSTKITTAKIDFEEFLSVLEVLLRDLLAAADNREELIFDKRTFLKIKNAQGFTRGAILYALDAVNEAEKRRKANTNATMLKEWLLFKILEGKFKWRKS